MFTHPDEIWIAITHLGAVGIMLPMFLLISAGLWRAGQKSDLLTWILAMSAGGAVVLASKFAFIGWGWGSAALDFTGISGHTMLATSIFPVWMGRLLAGTERRFTLPGVLLGLTIGAAVGVSRLVLGAHSPSEVVAGWLVGLAVSLAACTLMRERRSVQAASGLGIVVLLLAFSPTWSGYFPTHKWEIRIALTLSGHARPYVRQDLHRSLRESAHGLLWRG